MNGQDEFRDLEQVLKNLPQKQLDPKAFSNIHQHLMDEADCLDGKDRRSDLMRKSFWGLAGAAALFLFVFLGMSMVGLMSSENSESKMAMDGGAVTDRKAENSIINGLSLVEVEDMLIEQGFEIEVMEPDSKNVFHQSINGTGPAVYKLPPGELSVYVYEDEGGVQEAFEQFQKSTAVMKLKKHEIYQVKNLMMFYVNGEEGSSLKINEGVAKLAGTQENGWFKTTGLGTNEVVLNDLYIQVSGNEKQQYNFVRRTESGFTIVDVFAPDNNGLLYTYGESLDEGNIKQVFLQQRVEGTSVKLWAEIEINRSSRQIVNVKKTWMEFDPEPLKTEGDTSVDIGGPTMDAMLPAKKIYIWGHRFMSQGSKSFEEIEESLIIGIR